MRRVMFIGVGRGTGFREDVAEKRMGCMNITRHGLEGEIGGYFPL